MAGQFDLDQAVTLENAVFQAIGAASVCWDTPEGAGVFNSDRAKTIGEELLEDIQRRTNSFPRCGYGNKMGECVLADGHETYPPMHIEDRPETAHIDRNGKRWNVGVGGS